jgi:uncharacterized protein YPO0396
VSDVQWGLSLDVPDTVGFRLWNVELLNWGTFDGNIVSFPIEGHDAFVTGSVGAGKSTLVDALTTMFVPTGRLVYNRAAGSNKNERRLETYLKGVYSTAADDTGTRAKPVSLRDTRHLSAILAHFRDEQADVDAVFIHVYYFTAAGSIEKIYGVADRPITLQSLLAGANSDPRTLQKLIRERVTRCDTWRDYLTAVRRKLGLPHEQALDLWYQTVSMKHVENLTNFVRSHMLEPPDETRAKIEALLNHYQDLTASAAAIARAKAQLAVLDPLIAHLDDYDRHATAGDTLIRIRDNVLEPYYQGIELAVVETDTASTTTKLTTARAHKHSLEQRLTALDERIHGLDRQMNEAGGAALAELERRIDATSLEIGARQQRRATFEARCSDAGVTPAQDLDGFLAMRQEVQRSYDEAAQHAEENRPDYDTISLLKRHEGQLRDLEDTIDSLRRRRSNLDPVLLDLRGRIASAARVAEDDLPFVGELLRVRPDRADWEPAAQRLLHGFGTTLLVPETAYRTVSEWVDATDLRWRITYQAVPAAVRPVGRPAAGTLPEIIEVASSTPMSEWLASELMRRFRNIVLAESLAAFRDAEQAITKHGQSKRLGRIHDKDDRHKLGDRRRYVLGWDNKEKVATLTADAAELRQEIARLDGTLRAAEHRQQESQKVMTAADALLRDYADFTAVDVVSSEATHAQLVQDRDALLAKSSTLAELRAAKAAEKHRRDETAERHEKAVGDVRQWEVKLEELAQRRDELPEAPHHVAEEDRTLLETVHSEAQLRVAVVTRTNLEKVKSAAREALQGRIDALTARARRAREAALTQMQRFKERYPQDSLDMDAAIESTDEFRTVHTRLTDDDLPRYEAEFRRQLSENTLREIAGFNQHLEQRRVRIKDRIDRINESLLRIDYTRDTYIAVEPSANSDRDLVDFRRDLKQCIDGTLGGSEETYTRQRFEQVQAIVERFKGRDARADEDRNWTARVTDVRNWYTFAIVERQRDSGETVAYYSDSEGKSGGEKEKLAYTVLAAALSYQFGLVPGDPRSKTFRFIALDEAFARGSDRSTEFALNLFKTMGLQLLVVTPLQKKEVIAPYVQRVALIVRDRENRSRSVFMKIAEYRERLGASRAPGRESPAEAASVP